MIGTAVPSSSSPSTSTSGPPTMKSTCVVESFSPSEVRSSWVRSSPPSNASGSDCAERDVRGRVLVEQRVHERQPCTPHAGVAVDERDLAEVARAFVGLDLLAHDLLAARRLHLDDLAVREAKLEVADDRALDHERERRADRPFGAAQVRAREDLLGRQVRDVRLAPRGLGLGGHPARARREADRQVGAGARNRTASKRRSFSDAARALSVSMCSRQAATGSGSSSRTVDATTSQSRSTSGSPSTSSAQPAFGQPTIAQASLRSPISPR